MYNISQIDMYDFNFAGKWLSDFDAVVAGEAGFNNFSMTPSMTKYEEPIQGIDGVIVTAPPTIDPRPFVIPIMLNDSDKIRAISAWLCNKSLADFYWKNDSVKISCQIDSSIDMQNFITQGLFEIKFKAPNPFFTELVPLKYILNIGQPNSTQVQTQTQNVITLTSASLSTITLQNDGNYESKPFIKLVGNGTLIFGLNGNVFTVTNVTDFVYIDMQHYTVYNGDTNYYPNITFANNKNFKDFVIIPGENVVSANVNITSMEITPRSKWI